VQHLDPNFFSIFFKKFFICFKINELATKKFFTQSPKKVIFPENSICERFSAGSINYTARKRNAAKTPEKRPQSKKPTPLVRSAFGMEKLSCAEE